MKNYSVSFDSMLIFKLKRPQDSLLGVSPCGLLIAGGGFIPEALLASTAASGPPSRAPDGSWGISHWTPHHAGPSIPPGGADTASEPTKTASRLGDDSIVDSQSDCLSGCGDTGQSPR